MVDGAVKLLSELDIKEMLAAQSPAKFASKPQTGVPTSKSTGTGVEMNPAEEKKANASRSGPPLEVTLRGLVSMHKSSQTSILYSSPLDSDLRLYQFCQKLRDIFMKAGFIAESKKALLLHATVVNTLYARGAKGSGHGKKGRARLLFDARKILEDLEDFEFMSGVRVEKVAICRMGAKAGVDGEERYEVEAEIDVPEL